MQWIIVGNMPNVTLQRDCVKNAHDRFLLTAFVFATITLKNIVNMSQRRIKDTGKRANAGRMESRLSPR
jgi:hypothetical protein